MLILLRVEGMALLDTTEGDVVVSRVHESRSRNSIVSDCFATDTCVEVVEAFEEEGVDCDPDRTYPTFTSQLCFGQEVTELNKSC